MSLTVPKYNTARYESFNPDSICTPHIRALCRRTHPTDWPTPLIQRLFNLPDPLPTGDPLPLGTVPPHHPGKPVFRDAFDSLKNTLKLYYESNRSRSLFVPVLHAFNFWLSKEWRPLSHTSNGVYFNIFDVEHKFYTHLTLSHAQIPYLTVVDEESRAAYRTVPLLGKWYGLRAKEAEYGLCGHDFAVLLGMAQIQRFERNVQMDTYKVHVMYISSQGSPADTAIIVTAIIPGHLLDGLELDPPTLNLDGLKFMRNTVKLPQPDQEPQDCELFKALMFIIVQNLQLLVPFIDKRYPGIGENYAHLIDGSSQSH